jgi:hypothetical protein
VILISSHKSFYKPTWKSQTAELRRQAGFDWDATELERAAATRIKMREEYQP